MKGGRDGNYSPLLPSPVLVFAGTPQFLALATPAYSDASRSNLKRLGKSRRRNYKNRRCRSDGECKSTHSLEHYKSSRLNAGESRLLRMFHLDVSFLGRRR